MWSTLLGAFDIKYMPRTSVKGQVIADLVAEFAEPSVEAVAEGENMDEKSVGTISAREISRWKVYVDDAANQKGSFYCGDNFCFKGQGLDHVRTLGNFCCPTLEGKPFSSCHIRDDQ